MNAVNPSEKKIDLSIIIVNYNTANEIENCLNSLFEKNDLERKVDYEIIIVDNNSTDKNLCGVEKKLKKNNVQFYYLDKNIGFGKGCNYGFSKAFGKYICFLNPDTLIKEDIFSPIINLFEKDKSIGIIGPRQQTRTPFFDFSAGFYPNIFFELFNLFGVGVFLEGFIVSVYTKFKKGGKIEVDWILGAAMFIRAELFEQIRGFDKDYFMFFEEVDLCKRVSNKGLKIIYYPKLAICHVGSVSSKKDYTSYTIRTYSSKYIYISKHYKSFQKLLMRLLLNTQLYSQIIIWSILFPFNKQKTSQKLRGFLFLIKHKMSYEHRY